jgi:hypothetical protein
VFEALVHTGSGTYVQQKLRTLGTLYLLPPQKKCETIVPSHCCDERLTSAFEKQF